MYLCFHIKTNTLEKFITHWASKYNYKSEYKYDNNIRKKLTEKRRRELFEWKNGSRLSLAKSKSVNKNYPFTPCRNIEERYLNHKNPGGAIWNIFYLHCLKPSKWPMYDQHTHRAMMYIKNGQISEIGNKQKAYKIYRKEYIPFIKKCFGDIEQRNIDKALFAFGKFLKTASKYI